MKKLLNSFLALAVVFSCATAVFAAPYSSAYELYLDWEQEGYPDYVAGVYSTDGSGAHLTVQLVDDADGTLEAALRQQLEDDSTLTVEPGSYAYHTLLDINQEIVDEYIGIGPVVSCGIGWGADGGFGPSGKESRVVVTVLEEDLAAYRQLFAEAYGDAVVVEEGAAVHDLLLDSASDKDAVALTVAPAPLDANPSSAASVVGTQSGGGPLLPAPMPTSTSGNTVLAVIALVVLVGGAVFYGIATRKDLQ